MILRCGRQSRLKINRNSEFNTKIELKDLNNDSTI